MEIIDFNVGGICYSTTLTTLKQVPDNLLLKLAQNSIDNKISVTKKKGKIFIDRDGEMFKHILNYLRNPET